MLQQKLATYRTLLSLLEPLRKPQKNVQPNLVTRDAPIATELRQVQTLAIRVATRVNDKYRDVQVPASAEDDEMLDAEMKENNGNAKLGALLSTW